MLNVTVICVGKCKEPYLRDACSEYAKRLQAFCRLKVVELGPAPLPSKPSDTEIRSALAAEEKKIRAALPGGCYTYALCIEGKERPSEAFSKELEQLAVNGTSHIAFLIGSSYGLSESLKKDADERFSMSEMTFPHQLARVMLLEQVYRAFEISSGGKYHK